MNKHTLFSSDAKLASVKVSTCSTSSSRSLVPQHCSVSSAAFVLGNIFLIFALWLESSLLFSWQATGLLLFQILYTIDLVGAFITGSHIVGGTEYMFDPNLPLFIRLLSLFHVAVPPLLLWAIWRLGYDRRGWLWQTLMAWVVVPVNYLWRPQFDVNWARGPFFREQHAMPGLLYLLGYLVVVPLAVYFPTHLLLQWWARRGGFLLAAGRGDAHEVKPF